MMRLPSSTDDFDTPVRDDLLEGAGDVVAGRRSTALRRLFSLFAPHVAREDRWRSGKVTRLDGDFYAGDRDVAASAHDSTVDPARAKARFTRQPSLKMTSGSTMLHGDLRVLITK
jgi:hypothetical protein